MDELSVSASNRPDGTVKDSLRMTRGYWEAKDSHDDLDVEIPECEVNRMTIPIIGYPCVPEGEMLQFCITWEHIE